MSDMIEILDTDDVEGIVRMWIGNNADFFEEIVNEWVGANVYEFVPSQDDVERIVEMGIESEVEYGSINTAFIEVSDRIDEIEDRLDGTDTGHDLERLEERIADLERKNEKLLETLGQFAQLLTHRDLI